MNLLGGGRGEVGPETKKFADENHQLTRRAIKESEEDYIFPARGDEIKNHPPRRTRLKGGGGTQITTESSGAFYAPKGEDGPRAPVCSLPTHEGAFHSKEERGPREKKEREELPFREDPS